MASTAFSGVEIARQRRLESPTRPSVELSACIGWMAAAALVLLFAFVGLIPTGLLVVVCGLLFFFAGIRGWQYLKGFGVKARLFIYPFSLINPARFAEERQGRSGFFLGYGFRWGHLQAQNAHDLGLIGGSAKIMPPKLILKLWKRFNAPQATLRDFTDPEQVGESWIHGLGKEAPIIFSEKASEGNTVIFGATGSGKTRLSELLASQAIRNGDVVIALDPKGDKDFEARLRHEARLAGRPYVYFHPAHARESVHLSPLSQWHRPTEIASRVAALIKSESEFDSFSAFGWMTIETVVNGILILNQQPTLIDLKKYIQWGPDKLLESVLSVWFDDCAPEWQSKIHEIMEEPRGGKRKQLSRLEVMVQFYQENDLVKENSEIDSLISMTLHNREHYSKMNASLLPILDMLTAGDLGDLLSPNPAADPTSDKPIWDMARIIQRNAVAYIGLDTLADSTVGSAVGSLINAELASVAGAIYNWIPRGEMRTVSLFSDETSETLNEPLIQIANKARGAKFRLYAFAQTLSDFPAKLGSADKGRMFAGNFNNIIVLRSRDGATLDYCTEQFPKTQVQTIQVQHNVVAGTKEAGMHFAGSTGEKATLTEAELVEPSILGELPNFNYFALIGGQVFQGRFPIVEPLPTGSGE